MLRPHEALEARLRGAWASPTGNGGPKKSVKEGIPQQVMAIWPLLAHRASRSSCRTGWQCRGPGCAPGPASQHAYLGAAPGPRLCLPSRRWPPAAWTHGAAAAGPGTRSGRRPQYRGLCAAGEQAQGERVSARHSLPPATFTLGIGQERQWPWGKTLHFTMPQFPHL